jgi:hypothetical protein
MHNLCNTFILAFHDYDSIIVVLLPLSSVDHLIDSIVRGGSAAAKSLHYSKFRLWGHQQREDTLGTELEQ